MPDDSGNILKADFLCDFFPFSFAYQLSMALDFDSICMIKVEFPLVSFFYFAVMILEIWIVNSRFFCSFSLGLASSHVRVVYFFYEHLKWFRLDERQFSSCWRFVWEGCFCKVCMNTILWSGWGRRAFCFCYPEQREPRRLKTWILFEYFARSLICTSSRRRRWKTEVKWNFFLKFR